MREGSDSEGRGYDPAGRTGLRPNTHQEAPNLVIGALLFCVAAGMVLVLCRNLPAEHRVNQFFAAVETQDFSKAFGIWNNDPDWQEHTQRYAKDGIRMAVLSSTGAESGDYGRITSHKVLHSISYGNSTLLAVEINGRKEALALAVTREHAYDEFPTFQSHADEGWPWLDLLAGQLSLIVIYSRSVQPNPGRARQ